MENKIQERLKQLKTEYQSGQQMLQELQQKQVNLEQTMLRIAGAIQVLEEVLENGEEIVQSSETEASIIGG